MATDKKCPKCRSTNFQIVDYEMVANIYEVDNGYVTAEGQDDDGSHIKTSCVCRKCGHIWHPKNFEFTIDE